MAGYSAILGGLFIFCLVVMIFGSIGFRKDHLRKRVSNVLSDNEKNTAGMDDDLDKSLYERLIEPFMKSVLLKLSKLRPKKKGSPGGPGKQKSDKLKKKLRQAGISLSVEEYTLISTFVLAGLASILGLLAVFLGYGYNSALGVVFGAFVGYTVLRMNLSLKISGRRGSMEKQMPDVLDLLSVNVEAGLGFEQALLQVVKQFEGPLIDELTITCREISMGRPRREALLIFAERCNLDEIRTFVGSIVQAEQLGISIKNVLRTQAAAMRAGRRSKIEEKAQKVQVKMLLPMVGLIFPVLFIVLLGPAVVQIIQTL